MASGASSFTLVVGAALAAGWASTLGKAQKDIGVLGQAMQATSEKQRATKGIDLTSYKSSLAQLRSSGEALAAARASVGDGSHATPEQAKQLRLAETLHQKNKEAVDKHKASIQKQAAALTASGRDASAATREYQRLGDTLQKQAALGTAWDNAKQHSASFFKTIGASVGIVTAAGYGIARMVGNTANLGDEINQTSQRLGMTATALQEFRYAALQSNIEASAFDGYLDKLNVGLDDAAQKASGPVHDALTRLGLDAKKLAAMPADERLMAIGDAMQKLSDIEQQGVSADLFGKSASKMASMFSQGRDKLASDRKEAHGVGAVFDTSTSSDYDGETKRFRASLQGLANTVAVQLMPPMRELMEVFRQNIGGQGGSLGKIIAPLVQIVRGAIPVLGSVLKVAGALFGFFADKPALITALVYSFAALGAVLAVNKFGFAAQSAMQLFTAMQAMGAGGLLPMLATKMGSMFGGIMYLGKALIGVIPVIWSFTASLLACPVTWIIIGLIAVGAAIYALWKNWDVVTQWIGRAWAVVWDGIVWYYTTIWNGIKAVALGAWEFLKTVFSWSPLGLVIKAYGAMFKWLEDKFAIFSKIGGAFKWVAGKFGIGGGDTAATAADTAIKPVDTTIPIAKGGNKTISNSIGKIEIHAPSGVDAEEVARLAAKRIQEEQASMLDGALADPA